MARGQYGDAVRTVEDILAMVRADGGRVTTARRLLVEVLFSGPGHRTAEELGEAVEARAAQVALSTIYRNLDELERLGVVVRSRIGHMSTVYDLAWSEHGHLVCEACGHTLDAPDEMFRSLATSADREFGFAVDPRHVAVSGRCAACRT